MFGNVNGNCCRFHGRGESKVDPTNLHAPNAGAKNYASLLIRSAVLWACLRHISCSQRHHNANYELGTKTEPASSMRWGPSYQVHIPDPLHSRARQRTPFDLLPCSVYVVAPPKPKPYSGSPSPKSHHENPEMEPPLPLAPCGAWLETAKTMALDGACSDHKPNRFVNTKWASKAVVKLLYIQRILCLIYTQYIFIFFRLVNWVIPRTRTAGRKCFRKLFLFLWEFILATKICKFIM